MRRLLVIVAVAGAGAIFGVASVVQASIPSSNGVIHGCYQFSPPTTNKGVLRVINADIGEQCRFYEHPLDWNIRGVTGAQGPTGPTGPTWAVGPSADPDVYETRVDVLVPIAVYPAQTLVATLAPPPGSYIVDVLGEAEQIGGPFLDVGCNLLLNSTQISESWAQDDDGIFGSVAMTEARTTSTGDHFDVYCQTVDFSGSDNFVGSLRLTATKVSTLTVQ
jgi:hypothetical protein